MQLYKSMEPGLCRGLNLWVLLKRLTNRFTSQQMLTHNFYMNKNFIFKKFGLFLTRLTESVWFFKMSARWLCDAYSV